MRRNVATLAVVTTALTSLMASCARPTGGGGTAPLTTAPTTCETTGCPTVAKAGSLGTPPTSTTLKPHVQPFDASAHSSRPFRSDHDAITLLASTANQVALVTFFGPKNASTDQILQGDINIVGDSPAPSTIGWLLGDGQVLGVVPGERLIVFTSFNRGGTCISALFSFDPTSTATYITSEDAPISPYDRFPLPGRTLLIPHTVTLAVLERHLNPTGGTVYPVDTSEGACPGP
jgi:hypothetical protein